MQSNSTNYQRLKDTLLPELVRALPCDPIVSEKAFFRSFKTVSQKTPPMEEVSANKLAEAFSHYIQLYQKDAEMDWKERLRRGEASAWEEVYKTCYSSCAAKLAYQFQGDREDAKDIFQEAVTVLFKEVNKPGAHIFVPVRKFLESVAQKLKLNMLKGLPRQHRMEEYLVEQALIEPSISLPALLQPDDRFSQVMLQNLTKLLPQEQEILQKKHEGNSMDEIADHFGIEGTQEQRRSTARQRLHRAMEKLKNHIRKSLDPKDPLLRFLDKPDEGETPQA